MYEELMCEEMFSFSCHWEKTPVWGLVMREPVGRECPGLPCRWLWTELRTHSR